MTNARIWLKGNYPKGKRGSVEEIDISNKGLTGSLKLEGFKNLKKLNCSGNRLSSLDLTENIYLEKIDCSNNTLNSITFGNNSSLFHLNCSFNELSNIEFITTLPCPEKLLYLNLRNNCFSSNKLTVFSPFSQIKWLYLGTTDLARVKLRVFNQFYGSVKPLQDCKKLEELCLNSTEVNYGFEYLPDSLQEICLSDAREILTGEDLGHAKLLAELAAYGNNFTLWRNEKVLGSESLPRLIKERDAFQRLTNFWKENYENAEQKLADVKQGLESLRIENENLKEANTLIREKYERLMSENPQLQNAKELEKLLISEEENQAQIQVDTSKNIKIN